jgi:hypothetical protein
MVKSRRAHALNNKSPIVLAVAETKYSTPTQVVIHVLPSATRTNSHSGAGKSLAVTMCPVMARTTATKYAAISRRNRSGVIAVV